MENNRLILIAINISLLFISISSLRNINVNNVVGNYGSCPTISSCDKSDLCVVKKNIIFLVRQNLSF